MYRSYFFQRAVGDQTVETHVANIWTWSEYAATCEHSTLQLEFHMLLTQSPVERATGEQYVEFK